MDRTSIRQTQTDRQFGRKTHSELLLALHAYGIDGDGHTSVKCHLSSSTWGHATPSVCSGKGGDAGLHTQFAVIYCASSVFSAGLLVSIVSTCNLHAPPNNNNQHEDTTMIAGVLDRRAQRLFALSDLTSDCGQTPPRPASPPGAPPAPIGAPPAPSAPRQPPSAPRRLGVVVAQKTTDYITITCRAALRSARARRRGGAAASAARTARA